MTDYAIREVSLHDHDQVLGATAIVREAFGKELSNDKLLKNTDSKASQPSLYVAAMIGSEIIGFNGFISHDLILNGRQVNCYQSCWTATSAQHRGKKIFQNLVLTAHEILGARGAGFMFGFQNDASYPLFTKKLGYRELPSLKWRMPDVPLLRRAWIAESSEDIHALLKDAILQNDRQLIELKRGEYTDELIEVEYEHSLAWA